MIKSFACTETESLSKGERVKRFINIEAVAQRKLRQLQIAGQLNDLRVPLAIASKRLRATEKGNIAFVSMISGVFVSAGLTQALKTWK